MHPQENSPVTATNTIGLQHPPQGQIPDPVIAPLMVADIHSNENSKTEHHYYTGEAAFAPIALHVGSPVIRPIDKGKMKTRSLETAREQAEQQMSMLRKQADLLMRQARTIEERLRLAEEVYGSDMGFEPVVGQVYHLYVRKNGQKVLSMVGPEEWGGRSPFESFATSVRLLGDKTWEAVGTAVASPMEMIPFTPLR